MKNPKKILILIILLLALMYLGGKPANAVHKGSGDLTCGNCHTMHNSQGGGSNTLGGASGGSLIMLRAEVSSRENIHKLCLQCHSSSASASQATSTHLPHGQTAPKVHNPSSAWDENTHLTNIGAGGNFYPELNADFTLSTDGNNVALGRGHSLGLTTVRPPGGDMDITGFSCTSCHDPHGTSSDSDASVNRFRNLRKSVTNGGNNTGVSLNTSNFTSWVGGVTGLSGSSGANYTGVTADGANIWPVINSTPTGTPSTDYLKSNSYGGGSSEGISRWCAQCHDNWHEAISTTNKDSNGSDWHRHPVDNVLNEGGSTASGAGVNIIDSGILSGSPTNYNVTVGGRYLPVASGSGSSRVFYLTDATTDRVMCLSCHFAHGGPYNDNLRWNYTSSVGAGSQSGNPIATTKGCQLCHNR